MGSALVHRASYRVRRLLRAVFVRLPIIDRSFLGERREQVEDERVSLSATLGKQEWIISGGAMRGEWDNLLTVSDI